MIKISKTKSEYLVIRKSNPDFLTEDRLLDADYLTIEYNSIASGVYDYTLPDDGNGLLLTNGGLVYPSGFLNERSYYKKIVSNNPATLSHLSFVIDHTGNATDWLTDGNTGGTPSLNNIKFEFLIKRNNNDTFGWYNPFADYNTPYGVATTCTIREGMLTTVSCTLSITPRLAYNDLIIVRVLASAEWTNKIRNIKLENRKIMPLNYTIDCNSNQDELPAKIDEATATLIYLGYTKNLAADPSQPIWKIKQITQTGTLWEFKYADGDEQYNNIWDNRASLIYL